MRYTLILSDAIAWSRKEKVELSSHASHAASQPFLPIDDIVRTANCAILTQVDTMVIYSDFAAVERQTTSIMA